MHATPFQVKGPPLGVSAICLCVCLSVDLYPPLFEELPPVDDAPPLLSGTKNRTHEMTEIGQHRNTMPRIAQPHTGHAK